MAILLMTATMGEEQANRMHPFFNRNAKPIPSSSTSTRSTPSSNKPLPESSNNVPTDKPPAEKDSRSTRANTKAKRINYAENADAADSLEVDPNAGRRKRQKRTTDGGKQPNTVKNALSTSVRKTNGADIPDESSAWRTELETAAASADEPVETEKTTIQPQGPGSVSDESRVAPVLQTSQPDNSSTTTPGRKELSVPGNESLPTSTNGPAVKLLHFNPKTGTIGSPPKKPAKTDEGSKGKTDATKRTKKVKSLVVVMNYGHDVDSESTIGEKINRILEDGSPIEAQSEVALKTELPKATKSPKLPGPPIPVGTTNLDKPSKNTHPFFLGKSAASKPIGNSKTTENEDPEVKELPADNKHASNPISGDALLSVESDRISMVGRVSPTKKPRIKPDFPGFGKAPVSTTKFPGAMAPAWPSRGMVHIRGKSIADSQPEAVISHPILKSQKKSKRSEVQVLADEDVLTAFGKKLSSENPVGGLGLRNSDHYENPPSVIRLPSKNLRSGHQVQRQIRSEILTQLPRFENPEDDSSSEDEILGNGCTKPHPHPAISRVYRSIATSVAAFDKFECETQSWVQKYAPSSAEEVLQRGREAIVLRDWLQTLTVMLVDTGLKDTKTSTRPVKAPRKKKQKLSKAMGGFVVSSDEEASEMYEISEPEDELDATGGRGTTQKTVVRPGVVKGKGSGKLTNAVVISGPCGSGKTAAVYAVAKELDFEIFEINPGSRRSGKDILEKVGDMTRNHLVQSSSMGNSQPLPDEDMRSASEALDRDLKSGRQGTMNSFFKPTMTKPKPKPKPKKPKVKATSNESNKQPRKQKQSLILIEEADILYEEDKQFWATVMTLISQSKRPVIMTCTDESTIPLQSLSLHAIIRFTPPPMDLAVDYMLLVAANEGHILQRNAVKALYESRRSDLRGTMTELQFWCQFAIGDPRYGMNWRPSPWEAGCDINPQKPAIRTISEGTYDTGMGWLGRDYLEQTQGALDVEEETLRQAWSGWNLDAGDWHETLNMTQWAEKLQAGLKSKADEQQALNIYEDFVDAMSAADICVGHRFASGNKVLLDYSVPELPDKVRDDFTLGYQLLHAEEHVSHDNLGIEISFWLKSRARETVQVDQFQLGWKVHREMNHPSETRMIQKIRQVGTRKDDSLTRRDLSLAFDPIAEPERASISPSSLEPSVLDRTMTLIVLDVAPFIRSIVSYDARLQQERLRRSNLVSSGGRAGKRKLRTTRSANAALEGGVRTNTRPDRYFGNILNPNLVLLTGRQSWQDAALSSEEPCCEVQAE